MKKHFLKAIIIILTLTSCTKEDSIGIVGSEWENTKLGIVFKFVDEEVCKCYYTNNPNNNVLYGYTYKHPKISLYVSSCTGFENLSGVFTENTLTLNLLEAEDNMATNPISKEEVFTKK